MSLGCPDQRSECPCPLSLQHLQQHESGVEGESCYYHCVLCNYSTKAKLNLIQHVRSMKHQRSESLRKLQRLQKGLPEEDEDLGQIFTIRRCPSTDPGEMRHQQGRPWRKPLPPRLPPRGGLAWLLPVSIAGAPADPCVLDGRSVGWCGFQVFNHRDAIDVLPQEQGHRRSSNPSPCSFL